ncbi:unnamed protein product, partial [Iphiclides podalirius]
MKKTLERSVREYCRWMIQHPEHRRAPYLNSLGMFDPAVLNARLTMELQQGPSELQTREQSEHWTVSSHKTSEYRKLIRSKSTIRSKSKDLRAASKSTARSFPKFAPRRSQTEKSKDRGSDTSDNTPPESDDDLKVYPSEMGKCVNKDLL